MSPRIIAGAARGRRIDAPPGRATRPTSDRVREALFSILAPRLANAHVLDLFAGSGANGLEALSRGARSAMFVENDARCLRVIRANARALGLTSRANLMRANLPGGIDKIKPMDGGFAVAVADPPYVFHSYPQLLARLSDSGILAPDALVVIEHASRTDLPKAAGGLELTRESTYGETTLSFYA